jgi:NhaA family Na+:H+ antiporter
MLDSARSGRPLQAVLTPLREFLESNVAGGIFLLTAAVVALAWSNSPFADSYDALWATPLTIDLGGFRLGMDLHHWINDGLMAIFFLVVGLEIKRELVVGELASTRRAILPAAAAVGGAVAPALIFIGIVGLGNDAGRGWGMPMATDIAFALGVLAVLGRSIPIGLRIFVAALAIVDDLLAVLVIALFYTGDLNLGALAGAGAVLLLLIGANRMGIQQLLVYVLLGLVLWFAVVESGIHASIAGVALAMTIPAGRGKHSPMLRLEHALNRWVAFAIVPLFALANAGVHLTGDLAAMLVEPVTLGVVVGLLVGKQVGITTAVWLITRSGLASLPTGVTLAHVYGAAWVCAIGFTMSLFIGDLAYGGSQTLATAKLGILTASIIAAVGGYLILRWLPGELPAERDEPALPA